jgi:hypothetical protein
MIEWSILEYYITRSDVSYTGNLVLLQEWNLEVEENHFEGLEDSARV